MMTMMMATGCPEEEQGALHAGPDRGHPQRHEPGAYHGRRTAWNRYALFSIVAVVTVVIVSLSNPLFYHETISELVEIPLLSLST